MERIAFLPIVFVFLLTDSAAGITQLPPVIPRQVLFDNPAKKDP
jgi:hypothetical protein